MVTVDSSNVADDLMIELESLVALLENMDFGLRIKSWRLRPKHSAIRPGYNAKTYNQKLATVEDNRIISLPIFKFDIDLSETFSPKKHFMQFQQYSKGSWNDYALILMTDRKIGLVDLDNTTLLHTVETSFDVKALYVQSTDESLYRIKGLIETGRDILETRETETVTPIRDLEKIVKQLGNAHSSILFRTGMVGFFSGTDEQEYSHLESETLLGTLDLSKVSEGFFEVTERKTPIYLHSEVPMSESVRMNLTSDKEFTILEKVCYKF